MARCDVNVTDLGPDFAATLGLLIFYGESQIFGRGKKGGKILKQGCEVASTANSPGSALHGHQPVETRPTGQRSDCPCSSQRPHQLGPL